MTKALSPSLQTLQTRINQQLENLFNQLQLPSLRLQEAMRYSSLAGGKRLRPLLAYATGQTFQIPLTQLDNAAMALELIHTYSLIHDDLPAMDDDDLRRGQPTCHKAFDEATAILAGDALQALAFDLLSQQKSISAAQQLAMIQILANASGAHGMVGGQMLDIASLKQKISLEVLQQMHQLKTGALISASVEMALTVANITLQQKDHMQQFAQKIGLSFQIQDDLLDVVSTTEDLGKPTGKDALREKPTYPSLLGVAAAAQLLNQLTEEALEHLASVVPMANPLRELTDFIIQPQLREKLQLCFQ